MNKFWYWVAAGMLIGTIALLTPNDSPSPKPTESQSLSPKESADPFPEDTAEPARDFWADGIVATDTGDDSCTEFELCTLVTLEAKKACSAITLAGSTYDADDNYIDSFEVDYDALAAGKNRTVEFGTDALSDTEEYVELDDYTCWK